MEITEVRIKLVERSSERLRAFCSITLDGDFVIRDLKIIDGTNGAFVAMPSRKLADRCPRCGSKNHLRAKFCNECGQKLNENRAPKDSQGRAKLHADVAHPINAACRERIQKFVVDAFHAELEKSKSPDYKPPKYDDFEVDLDEEAARPHPRAAAPRQAPPPVVQPEPSEQPAAEPEPEPELAPAAEGAAGEDDFGDYNSLIADLKRDAAGRRERHEERRGNRPPAPPAPPPQQPEQSVAPEGQRQRDDRGRNRGGRESRENRGGRPGGGRPQEPRPAEQRHPAPPPETPAPAPVPPVPAPAQPAPEEDDFAAGL